MLQLREWLSHELAVGHTSEKDVVRAGCLCNGNQKIKLCKNLVNCMQNNVFQILTFNSCERKEIKL